MAYAALVSLTNTIDRFLNSNLYSISVEEEKQITSLLEYATPFQDFLDKFPDKFKSLEERMREVANEAEDILEYLVLEKVFLSSDEESEIHNELNRGSMIKDTSLKLKNMLKECGQDILREKATDNSLKGRIRDVVNEVKKTKSFLKWERNHIRFRDKWRFLPAEYAMLKSKLQFINHLKKMGNEIDSIMAEAIAVKNISSDKAASSSGLAPADRVSDDDDEKQEEEEEETECYRSSKHELQMERVMDEIALIAAQVKEIKDSSSSKDVERGGADASAAPSSSPTDPPIHKDSMVGFEDYVLDLKDRLCGEPSKNLQVIPICGMGGIGKTTLSRNVYDDPLIVENFVIRVWITISQDYSAQRILSSLVESLREYNTHRLGKSDDEKVHKILTGRKYLIVMDDMWSSEAWDVVRNVFPDDGNGSRIMLTTRLYDVASYPDPSSKCYELGLLNADQSWNLLKEKVFANLDCPSNLENIGKEIARRCKGLPLAIVVIAGLLSTVSKNPSSWLEIAEKVKSAETAEHDQIGEILSLSYVQLPQYFRPCFLYMGSFPADHEIHVLKLIRLWVAEGFVKFSINSESFEEAAEECLDELVKRNLVLVTKRKSDGRIKSCSLHDLIRELCIRKARESKFFLNLMDRHIEKEHFVESIKDERRVSVDTSYLNYLSSYGGSIIRSIKCSKYHIVKLDFLEGVRLVRVWDDEPADVESFPYHLVKLDFLEGVRLLKVLDAQAADVKSLPTQLFELFHLRYLAIRYSQHIPRNLSNLQNLQTLIIRQERSKFVVGVACEILVPWCMPQLRHVYFHGVICFEDPKETTCSLENLQTVSYVVCCSERILKKIPNLKKLKVDCSAGRDAAYLSDLVHLHQLENLVVYGGRRVLSRPKYYNFTFPENLKKLTLRNSEFPQSAVGSLPNLQVLKLKRCSCDGGTWETIEGAFPVLEVLLIKESRLENWITESGHFPILKRLMLYSCYDLNGIPNDIGEIPTLELIEITGKVKKSL